MTHLRIPFVLWSLVPAIVLLAAGCPPRSPHPPRPRPRSTAAWAASLQLPPTATVRQAVAVLRERAARGDRAARWALVRYGLDLYDAGRLTGDAASKVLLWRLVGLPGPVGSGRSATLRVLARLRAMGDSSRPESAGVARQDPWTREAEQEQLGRILASDVAFLERKDSLRARVGRLRALRRGPLRYAVLLRLYAPCAQAFRAAAMAQAHNRSRILNYCLESLYAVDARPHLARGRRVPDPPWTAYRRGLEALLDRVEAAGGRAAVIAARLRSLDQRFFREAGHRLPLPLGEWSALLPRISGGRRVGAGPELAWLRDRFLAGGQVVTAPKPRHVRVALSRLFFAYGKRTHLTLYAPRSLEVRRLRVVLERAVDVGYYTLGLGGVHPVASRAGYWRLTTAPVLERREVVVSLAPSSRAARMLKGLTPQQIAWDWRCAAHDLGLRVEPDGVTPVGPDGELSRRTAEGNLPAAVQAALGALRGPYPEECGIYLTAAGGLSVGALVAVLAHLRRLPASVLGALRYLGLRMDGPKPVPGGGAFAARVAARLRARVRVRGLPQRLASHESHLLAALRRCYLRSLDRVPTRWAVLRAQPTGERFLVTQDKGTVPESATLNRCVALAISGWVERQGIHLARVLRVRMDLAPPPR